MTIQAACAESGVGPVVSQAFRATAPLAPNADGHMPWALFAETVVADVPPGPYAVHFGCGSVRVAATFTVLARPRVPQKPGGAPETGDGSTA